MYQLIKFIIFGHIHHWDTIEYGNLKNSGEIFGRWFHERCTKCGKNVYRRDEY